jgi:hypothetical protein
LNDKLEHRLAKVEDEYAGEQMEQHIAAHKEAERDRALMLVGGFNAVSKLVDVICSELIRGYEQFQKEECWRALRFQSMADFLKSKYSRLSKNKYYELKGLLDKEGEQLFDLYSDIGLPLRIRKQLGSGQVEIEGQTVIIKSDTGEETRVDKGDWTHIVETITAAVDSKLALEKKVEKLKETVSRQDNTIRDLHNDNDRIKASKAADVDQDPHSIAIVNLTFAYHAVRDAYGDMSDVEREQFAPRDFALIARLMQELAEAAGRTDWTKIAPTAAAHGGSDIENVDDLDALMNKALDEDDGNDAELAASL